LIDDEPHVLLAISSILWSRGHYVKTFDNTGSALEHLAGETVQYDSVITDYRMPGGISGLDLAKTVKKHARKIKVSLMTAFDISCLLDFSEALQSEIVNEVLQKPIPNNKLIAIIEKSFLRNHH
jgi:DNA-binding NtrC family response regulator